MTSHKRGCPLFTHPTERGPNHPTVCTCSGLNPATQTGRLLAWLRANPGSSSIEVTMALRIVNVTGRVSDLRARGVVVECRSVEGVDRYYIVEPRAVVAGEQMSAFG